MWVFVYLMAIIGVGRDPKLYKRAGAWCWINKKYDKERLWLHYLWIFLCMFGTVVTYILIFLSITAKSRRHSDPEFPNDDGTDPAASRRAAKYMIIYPVVYVVCTLPLAGARMASMTGVLVPYWWFCLAGAAITSCGWLDVLLYAVTRHVLIFSRAPPPPEDLGFNTFGWKGAGQNFWGVRTTITGGDPNVRRRDKRDFLGRVSQRPSSRQSDEDHFAGEAEGVITAKTTIEVRSGPIINYADSEFSAIEMEDKSDRNHSHSHDE